MILTLDIDTDTGVPVGYMTTKEAAIKFNTEEQTVRMWILRGKLKCLRIGRVDFIKNDAIKPVDRRGTWRKNK